MKLLCLLSLMFLSATAKAAKQIEFATHYDYPPFVIDMKKQEGFVFDLARYLSKQSKGRYEFQVTYVPRTRIENYLSKKQTVVVPFVSPKWFSDEGKTRYLWTDVMMMDQNVVVSQTKSQFEYKDIDSINGKTMAYLLGHKVPVIDARISDGKIKREDSPSMIGNFKKVVEGRADFLVTGEAVVRYIIAREHWETSLTISKVPIDIFERRVLVSPVSEVELQEWLNSEVKTLIKSNQWTALLQQYNLGELSASLTRQSRQRSPAKAN